MGEIDWEKAEKKIIEEGDCPLNFEWIKQVVNECHQSCTIDDIDATDYYMRDESRD